MADSMCGPSNALQTFQKHSTADRTLQQDRLTSRQTPSQGFRSAGPNAGVLDPEFEAFQAGHFPLHPQEQQAFQQQALQQHGFANRGHPQLSQAGPSSWTNDFQRMNIANPSPHQQHLSGPPQQQGAWHEEFARQAIQQGGQNHMSGQSLAQERLSMLATGPMMGGYQPIQPMWNSAMSAQPQPQQLPTHAVEAFDEEAFKRAFDEAAVENVDTKEEVMLDESAEQLLARDLAQQERIGADMIHDPDAVNERHIQEQPDALSKTAGELLLRVQDNKSDKFQNSQFLQLMRQLRDKEVVVQGDKIVGVDESSVENQLRRLSHELHFPGLKHISIDEIELKSLQWKDRLRFGSAVRHLMFVLATIQSLLQIAGLDEIVRSGIGHFVHALESYHVMSLCPGLHWSTLTTMEMMQERGFYSDSESKSKAHSLLRLENYTSSREYTGEEVQGILQEWLTANDTKDSRFMDLLPDFDEVNRLPGLGRLDRTSRKDILGPDVHAIVSTVSHLKWHGSLSDERFIKMIGIYRSEIAFEDSEPVTRSDDPWQSLQRAIAHSRAPHETQRLHSFGKIVDINHARGKKLARRNEEALDRSRQDIADVKSQNAFVGMRQRNRLNQQTGFLLAEEVGHTEDLGTEKIPAMLNADQIKFLQAWLKDMTTDKQSRFWVLNPDQLLELLGAENYVYGQRPSPENLTTLQEIFGLECLVSMHWLSSSWSRTPIDVAGFLKIMRVWETKNIAAFVRENYDSASKKISKQSERFYRKVAHYRSLKPKLEDIFEDMFYNEAESQPQDQALPSLEQEHDGPTKFEGVKYKGELSEREFQKQLMLLEIESGIKVDMAKSLHDKQVHWKDRETQEKSRQSLDPDTVISDLGSKGLPQVRVETEQEVKPVLAETVVEPIGLNLLAKDNDAMQKESEHGAQAIQESINDIANDSTTGNYTVDPTIPERFTIDGSGKMWFVVPYELNGTLLEYTLNGGIGISLDTVQDPECSKSAFMQENLIYPQADCEKDAYLGTRWEYENCCNSIGLALYLANPILCGKRGLILAAVEKWEACMKLVLEKQTQDEGQSSNTAVPTSPNTRLSAYHVQLMELEQQNKKRIAMAQLSGLQTESEQQRKATAVAQEAQDLGRENLHIYQRQLLMLEQNNKKRLEMAREDQARSDAQLSASQMELEQQKEKRKAITHAEQDLQMQLILLEQQNKKRLAMARDEQARSDAQLSASQMELEQQKEKRKAITHAEQDLQMQLILLEQQNKKRLAMAREEQARSDAQLSAPQMALEQLKKKTRALTQAEQDLQRQLLILEQNNKKRLAMAQEDEDRPVRKVLLLKDKLEKGLISRNEPLKEEEMARMSEHISKLEHSGHLDLKASVITKTGIHSVFKAILNLPEIPLENEYHFKDRCDALLKRWQFTLARQNIKE